MTEAHPYSNIQIKTSKFLRKSSDCLSFVTSGYSISLSPSSFAKPFSKAHIHSSLARPSHGIINVENKF